MIMKLQDKVAIITGASRGIGKVTALLFAKENAKVVVNFFRSANKAEAVVNEIKRVGGDAIAIKADVSKEDEVKVLIAKTIEKFGRIDILVNNAGIVIEVPFKDRTVDHWQKTLAVNLIGTFLCVKYVVPHMLKQKDGRIVNIASTNGIDTFSPDSIDYDASKAGVIILTRSLSKELAPSIRVNCVAPGWVDTEMNRGLSNDFIKEETKKIYLKRFARPEEIAKAILFLASDDSSFVTGSTLKVDGGYG